MGLYCKYLILLVIFSSMTTSQCTLVKINRPKIIPERTLQGMGGMKSELCSSKPCIRKCCNADNVAIMLGASDYTGSCGNKKKLNLNLKLPNPSIYAENLEITNRTIHNFQILKGYKIIRDGWLKRDNFYVTENGTLLYDEPNVYNRWRTLDNDKFCIDYLYLNSTGTVSVVSFYLKDHYIQIPHKSYIIKSAATLLSSVFLVATVIVYGLIPQLHHSVQDKVVMCYSLSTLGYFLTQTIYQIAYEADNLNVTVCHVLGVPSYFLLLTAFFWLNVLCYHIYYTYKNTREELHKDKPERFLYYCWYGFGVPLSMSALFAFLNYLPMKTINRAVITPGITSKACLLGGVERAIYVLIPMGILSGVNLLFYVRCLLLLCSQERTLGQGLYRTILKRLVVAVKLFITMGLGWIFQIASYFDSDRFIWQIIDIYNYLMGVYVFIIFVCNKNVRDLMVYRFKSKDYPIKYSNSQDEILHQ